MLIIVVLHPPLLSLSSQRTRQLPLPATGRNLAATSTAKRRATKAAFPLPSPATAVAWQSGHTATTATVLVPVTSVSTTGLALHGCKRAATSMAKQRVTTAAPPSPSPATVAEWQSGLTTMTATAAVQVMSAFTTGLAQRGFRSGPTSMAKRLVSGAACPLPSPATVVAWQSGRWMLP